MTIEDLPRLSDEDREAADGAYVSIPHAEPLSPPSNLQRIADISGKLGTGIEALQDVIDLMLQEGDGGRFRLLTCVHAQLDRYWRQIERACHEGGAETATLP